MKTETKSCYDKANELLKISGWEFIDFGIYRIHGNEDHDDTGMIYVAISYPRDVDNVFWIEFVDPECVHKTTPLTFTEKDWDMFVNLMSRLAQFNYFMAA